MLGSHQVHHLIGRWGYTIVLLACGLQSAGVPVPGTTALIAAALYAGAGHSLSIVGVILAAAGGAMLGTAIGYAVGWWGGWTLLERYGHLVRLTTSNLRVGRYLFREHGAKVVFFGRFITGLRTWSAFLAGSVRMPLVRFFAFSGAAAAIWAVGNGLGYFYFGHALTGASPWVNALLIGAFLAWLFVGGVYLRSRAAAIKLAAERAYPDTG